MKKIISTCLAAVLGLSVFAFTPAYAAHADFVKSVTVNKTVPYGYNAVSSLEELIAVRENLDAKYILMNDIDLSSVDNWQSIGDEKAPFTGVFNGNGYAIKNLTVSVEPDAVNDFDIDNDNLGLFGYAKDAIIANVNVADMDISVDFPYSDGYTFGGIAGMCEASWILNCTASGNIDAKAADFKGLGGIVGCSGIKSGRANGTLIANCKNSVNINAVGNEVTGGLDYGNPTTSCVGGVAGVINNNDAVKRCINEGSISVKPIGKALVGGVCGAAYHNAPITDCANKGNLLAEGNSVTGGICGYSYSIENCYNAGSITAEKVMYSNAGGIAGSTQFEPEMIYYILPENGKDILTLTIPAATLKNCYYINTIETPVGNAADGDVSTVKALSEEEFKEQSSFVGFDFDKVWCFENSAPALRSKTSETGAYTEINGTDNFKLSPSIIYAESNNTETATIDSDFTVKVNQSGKASIDTISVDGDFVIIEVSAEIDGGETGILAKMANFFKSFFAWIIRIFDFS